MRLNQYLALHTGLSRRAADRAVTEGRVEINGILARLGDIVVDGDKVSLDSRLVNTDVRLQTVLLNKPIGYVVSREGQGNRTVYDLLPSELHNLKPVGRLDKDSSGLMLLTNDGKLANRLTHPSHQKEKHYLVTLDKDLSEADFDKITEQGVELEDGSSRFKLDYVNNKNREWQVTMTEGRNRQIRRTFEALGYRITKLHRDKFGEYSLGSLQQGKYAII